MTKFGIRALIALTVFAAGLSGCSQEGTLVIKNSASTEFTGFVDGTQVTIDTSGSYETTTYIGKSLAIVGPDHISVIVAGSATTKRSFSEEVAIKSGETTTFQIVDDTGALIFTNMYPLGSVNALAASPCDSFTFGPNLLEEKRTIPPGSTRTIQLDAGCWDIRINYGLNQLLEIVADVEIEVGQLIEIKWDTSYVYPPPAPPAPAR